MEKLKAGLSPDTFTILTFVIEQSRGPVNVQDLLLSLNSTRSRDPILRGALQELGLNKRVLKKMEPDNSALPSVLFTPLAQCAIENTLLETKGREKSIKPIHLLRSIISLREMWGSLSALGVTEVKIAKGLE